MDAIGRKLVGGEWRWAGICRSKPIWGLCRLVHKIEHSGRLAGLSRDLPNESLDCWRSHPSI